MNKLDILIIVVIAVPVLIGISSGFLKNLFGFIGIIAGLIIATKFNEQISDFFMALSIPGAISNGLAFMGVIIFFYIAGGFIAGKLSRLNTFTTSLDKLLGGIFGALQGLVIASLVLLFLKFFNFISVDTMAQSLLYGKIVGIAPEIIKILGNIFPFIRSTFEGSEFFKVN